MDYIILNNDGSIANLPSLVNPKLKRYIQQGNNGVDKIFIGWPLGLSTDYGQAVFTLANQLTNTVLGEFKANYPYEADDPENPPSDYDGETCNGWVITLTSDQTIYNGGLFVSFRVIRNGIIQVAFPFTLMINETGVRPDTDSGVTIAQLDSYLLNIQNLVTGAVRQNTDAVMSETSENPVQNKVVTQRINSAIAGVYKPGGTKTVAQLNALTKDASLNGYVYNVGDSGTLYDGLGGDIEVRTGDNVCLIYGDSENWYWDNMVGFIDTSLFVTKSGENILSGTYYIRGDHGLSFGREGATYHRYDIKSQEEGDSVDVVCYSLTDPEADPVVVGGFTTEGFYAPVVRTQKLKNNNVNYGLLLPDMSDWTSDKSISDLAGGKVYLHKVALRDSGMSKFGTFAFYRTSNTHLTKNEIAKMLYDGNIYNYDTGLDVGFTESGSSNVIQIGGKIYGTNATTLTVGFREVTATTDGSSISFTTSSQSKTVNSIAEYEVIEM